MTKQLTNAELLKLQMLYSNYMYFENADSNYNLPAVNAAYKAFSDHCADLGISNEIGKRMAVHVFVNEDYLTGE